MRLWAIPVAALCLAAAEPSPEMLDLFTNLAANLSANDAQEFLSAFDPNMPGYARLRDGVTGLTRAGEIQSSVEVVNEEGDAGHRTVEVDWQLRIRSKADATASVPRRQHLAFKLEKRGKNWKIVSLDPAGFFAP
jgi:hypothetical protein